MRVERKSTKADAGFEKRLRFLAASRHAAGNCTLGIFLPRFRALLIVLVLLPTALRGSEHLIQPEHAAGRSGYVGFDQNNYPGDNRLAILHRSFAYTGYYLNVPPGADTNSWRGKRELLRSKGFGFLVLYNGRLDAQLTGKDATALGRSDAAAAITAAVREGFPARAILFLDQEEGGRLLPEQNAYLFAWMEAIRKSQYRAGLYCSGIEVGEGADRISTAEDVVKHWNARAAGQPKGPSLALWVANDQCPPSPGCVAAPARRSPEGSGFAGAQVWQFAQSPRRPQFTRECAASYSADGNCYAPGLPHDAGSLLDLDLSISADPSSGR